MKPCSRSFVPTNDSIWMDEMEELLPVIRNAADKYPEEPVEIIDPGSFFLSFIDGELLQQQSNIELLRHDNFPIEYVHFCANPPRIKSGF